MDRLIDRLEESTSGDSITVGPRARPIDGLLDRLEESFGGGTPSKSPFQLSGSDAESRSTLWVCAPGKQWFLQPRFSGRSESAGRGHQPLLTLSE